MVCGHSKPVLARCLSSQGKSQFRTVPTDGDPHTYRHRAVFERVPAELRRTGSVDADTYQTHISADSQPNKLKFCIMTFNIERE